ncbi:MAG: substrate-binding domain-containing protein [Alphaproteobacteria bacterium]
MPIAGLGPHGERAVPFDRIILSDADSRAARQGRFSVAVVLHTTDSDWSRQQLAGIVTTLGHYSAAVVDVIGCDFQAERQVEALGRLIDERPDAIISIPIGNTQVAEAHHRVSQAGIRLVLIDNAPTGLLPGSDYASVISADNFGLGQVAAELLSGHVPERAAVGMLTYGVDFFVTNEREIAFRRWMAAERPDIILRQARFSDVDDADRAARDLLAANPGLGGLFVVWDEPAMKAVAVLHEMGTEIPVTTIDLGNEAALELAQDGLIKGIGAQQPYDQGSAAATAALPRSSAGNRRLGIALPGLAVMASNVLESYQVAWHAPAPADLVKAWRS